MTLLQEYIGYHKSNKKLPKADHYLVKHGHHGCDTLGVVSADRIDQLIKRLKQEYMHGTVGGEVVKHDAHFFWNEDELRVEYKIQYSDDSQFYDPEKSPEEYWGNKYDHWTLNNHVLAKFIPMECL